MKVAAIALLLSGCLAPRLAGPEGVRFVGAPTPYVGSEQVWVCGYVGVQFSCVTLERFLESLPPAPESSTREAL